MEQPKIEQIPSGEWSAAAVAQNDPQIYADVIDLFDEIFAETDPRSFLGDVLHAQDPEASGRAYQDLLGIDGGDL